MRRHTTVLALACAIAFASRCSYRRVSDFDGGDGAGLAGAGGSQTGVGGGAGTGGSGGAASVSDGGVGLGGAGGGQAGTSGSGGIGGTSGPGGTSGAGGTGGAGGAGGRGGMSGAGGPSGAGGTSGAGGSSGSGGVGSGGTSTTCAINANCQVDHFCGEGRCVSDVVTVAAGYAHTCALRKDSKVFCWGANESGQLGLPASSDDVLRPAEVTSLPAIRKLALGGEFSCAITSDDRVVCWGDDQVGQLGDGAAGGSRYTPSYVKTEDGSDLRFVTDLGATIGSACALTSSGVKGVHCWGYNHRSQLGRPSSEIAQSPAALLVPSSSSAMMLAVGETTVHFVAGDTICGWGANTGSAITNGGGSVTTPTCFTLSSVLQTVLGGGNGCARLTSGDVRCWGYTLGSPTMQPPPGMVLPGIAAVGLGGGTSHLCGVDTTATVKCWGFNAMGALGDGTSQDSTAPRTVLNAQGSVLSDVLPGGISLGGTSSHSCAVLGDGSLYCWGANEQGQVGSGVATAAERRAVPVRW